MTSGAHFLHMSHSYDPYEIKAFTGRGGFGMYYGIWTDGRVDCTTGEKATQDTFPIFFYCRLLDMKKPDKHQCKEREDRCLVTFIPNPGGCRTTGSNS